MHRSLADGTAVFDIEVLVGLPHEPRPLRDRYRSARLCFRDVDILAVDVPDASSSFLTREAAVFVIAEDEEGTFTKEVLAELPPGRHTYSMFLVHWQLTIRAAAADVDFEWK
jgi:hypothetical protein